MLLHTQPNNMFILVHLFIFYHLVLYYTMDITIVPSFTVNTTQGSIGISVVSITPYVSATISVTFYDTGGYVGHVKRVNRIYLELTGTDYSNWVNDDWLVNYVLTNVNATQAGDY